MLICLVLLKLDLGYDHNKILAATMKVLYRDLVLSVCNIFDSPNPYGLGRELDVCHFFERLQFVGTKALTLESREAQWIAP